MLDTLACKFMLQGNICVDYVNVWKSVGIYSIRGQ